MLYVCNFHVFFNDILDPQPTTRIKVSKLPDNATEDVIKYFFENRKVSGGGVVDTVDYDKTTHTAVVIFEEAEGLFRLFKEYFQFLNRLYDISWLGAVYA